MFYYRKSLFPYGDAITTLPRVQFQPDLPRQEKFDSAHNLTLLHLFSPSLFFPNFAPSQTLKRPIT